MNRTDENELYLVSPCILGIPTRWDGGQCLVERLVKLAAQGRLLPFCTEAAGGLSIPRPEAEIMAIDGDAVLFRKASDVDGHDVLDGKAKVVSIEGTDVTSEYVEGAQMGLALAKRSGIKVAILKAYSPACGSRKIYDGTFSLTLKPGQGVLAALLTRNGITVYSENELDQVPGLAEDAWESALTQNRE